MAQAIVGTFTLSEWLYFYLQERWFLTLVNSPVFLETVVQRGSRQLCFSIQLLPLAFQSLVQVT